MKIPERILVGLSAIEQTNPEWLDSGSFRNDPVSFLRSRLPPEINEALSDEELKMFPTLLNLFRFISSGVEIRSEASPSEIGHRA